MDLLRVRVYNVRFGDAILVSVPDRVRPGKTETRHILIDVGNVLGGEGGVDALFRPVVQNICDVLAGRPLDFYVMTHEHIDHVQGLPYAAEKLGLKLDVQYAWLTASAAEDYYERHPEAKKRRLELLREYEAIASFLQAAPERETSAIHALMANNNPRDTSQCVAYLRKLAAKTSYVYRGCDLAGTHPFREARLQVWAPEEDTASYYGILQPTALGVSPGEGASARLTLAEPLPPSGVDAGAFYNLVEMRRRGCGDNLLAIDKAANNTSVVFCLEWRGWRLLFPGDAELRSWRMMDRQGMLQPVHFLKISHHGSYNGTPAAELLNKILPKRSRSRKSRRAVLSTYKDTYYGVPDAETLALLSGRCTLQSVENLPDGGYLDIELEG